MDFDVTWPEAEVYQALQDVLFCLGVRKPGRVWRGNSMQKRAPTELGSTLRAQTWSVGIFFEPTEGKNGNFQFRTITKVVISLQPLNLYLIGSGGIPSTWSGAAKLNTLEEK